VGQRGRAAQRRNAPYTIEHTLSNALTIVKEVAQVGYTTQHKLVPPDDAIG
jgi:hypothetical protein